MRFLFQATEIWHVEGIIWTSRRGLFSALAVLPCLFHSSSWIQIIQTLFGWLKDVATFLFWLWFAFLFVWKFLVQFKTGLWVFVLFRFQVWFCFVFRLLFHFVLPLTCYLQLKETGLSVLSTTQSRLCY